MPVAESYIRFPVAQESNFQSNDQWYAWILSSHYDFSQKARTEIGELVSNAKYGEDASAVLSLKPIVRHAAFQLRQMPKDKYGLASIDVVIAVPSFILTDSSLPHVVAEVVSASLSKPNFSNFAKKVIDTPPAKFSPVLNPDAYEISRRLDGLNVLIVDDLFHTGSTLESVAIKVREAGAKSVTGFCLTKVNKGLN